MVELFFNDTVARENKLWTVKAKSDALGPGLGSVLFGPLWAASDRLRATSRWVTERSAAHLCCCSNPGRYGKGGMVSQRTWAIYKINIKSDLHYAPMIVQAIWASASCVCKLPRAGEKHNPVRQTLGRKVERPVCGQVMTCVFSCFLVRAFVIGISYSKHR